MMYNRNAVVALIALGLLAACKEKKETKEFIAPKIETKAPAGPVSMQPYNDQRGVQWLGKTYKVEVSRVPCDSLPKVKDETGQLFVDNRISVRVLRSDGSVAISKTFTKATFESYVNGKYRKAGILEGLVFDKVDGQQLAFAASVSLPQTDEYIPLDVKIDNFGNVRIELDSEMDTSGTGEADEDDDEGV